MKYKKLDFLGEGAFAKVYKVEDDQGNFFAMKEYSPSPDLKKAVGDEHLKKRFSREIKYQSQVKQNNVVQILDSDTSIDCPYFVMKLAECSLHDELNNGDIKNDQYTKILFDILSGLECIHEQGYTHRDLKPANILKFNTENSFYYAISDFGLMSVSENNSSTLTATNAQGGTPNYAAPELIRNFKAATKQADIYSFGAILYDIFVQSPKRIPYSELKAAGEIGEIIAKCTKKNPVRRYSNIASLRDALYEVLNENKIVVTSYDEQQAIDKLAENEKLNEDDWDEIFVLFENSNESLKSCTNIFRSIKLEHIKNLNNESPELCIALGNYFANFITLNSFDFDYCDILANKAELLHELGDLTVKSRITLALLDLGTSHNRWYVERKFVAFAGRSIDEKLAKRIVTEIEVTEVEGGDNNFLDKIEHLERSIAIKRTALHPIILEYIRSA